MGIDARSALQSREPGLEKFYISRSEVMLADARDARDLQGHAESTRLCAVHSSVRPDSEVRRQRPHDRTGNRQTTSHHINQAREKQCAKIRRSHTTMVSQFDHPLSLSAIPIYNRRDPRCDGPLGDL